MRNKAGGGKQKAKVAVTDKLFDLKTDAAEKNNVAAEHPDELKRLQTLLDKLIADGRSR